MRYNTKNIKGTIIKLPQYLETKKKLSHHIKKNNFKNTYTKKNVKIVLEKIFQDA